jgi:hypothetical protein
MVPGWLRSTVDALGATHFKVKKLHHVATEMALHVLAYNIKRVIAIFGVPTLIEAIRAFLSLLAALLGLHRRDPRNGNVDMCEVSA